MMKNNKKGKENRAYTKRLIKRYIPIYLLMLPGIVYLLINNYLPMVGLQLAFKEYSLKRGIFGSKFVGLKNFEYLFKTRDAWIITRNTVCYNLVFIVLGTVFCIFVALLLSEVKGNGIIKLYQTVVLFPYLISIIVS